MRTELKLAVLAAAVALVACGKKEEAAAPATAPTADQLVVKIGHVGATSGPVAHLGKDNENGARMAIDDLNAAGVMIGGKKVKFEEISEKDSNKKVVKITGKVLLSKTSFQMNLEDGSNFIVKDKFSTGSSAVLNLKENKIEKILELKEGSKVFVIAGKHSGKEGKVKEANALLPKAFQALDKAAKGNTIKDGAASRKKSRLNKLVKKAVSK